MELSLIALGLFVRVSILTRGKPRVELELAISRIAKLHTFQSSLEENPEWNV